LEESLILDALLATKENEDIGIITERDIVSKIIAEKRDLETVKVIRPSNMCK